MNIRENTLFYVFNLKRKIKNQKGKITRQSPKNNYALNETQRHPK